MPTYPFATPTHAPPLPEGLRDFAWQCFTSDTSAEDAAARFQDRHGRPPEYILESLNNLLVGPVPEESST